MKISEFWIYTGVLKPRPVRVDIRRNQSTKTVTGSTNAVLSVCNNVILLREINISHLSLSLRHMTRSFTLCSDLKSRHAHATKHLPFVLTIFLNHKRRILLQ